MNKTDMVTKLAEKNGMSKKDAQKALESVVEIISGELKDGGSVTLTGFGTFSIAERKPRTGRNPQTGQPIDIPAKRVPKFKAGKLLKGVVG
jgi:DNA-binding protein HU-beta